MKLEAKAKHYAEALLNVAVGIGAEKAVKDSLELVNSSVKASPEFRAVKLFIEIGKAYQVKFAKVMNFVTVTAHVTSKMSDISEAELKASLETALGKSTELTINVDPSLIGGIKLRVGNTFLDASIQNQLENMRHSLLKV